MKRHYFFPFFTNFTNFPSFSRFSPILGLFLMLFLAFFAPQSHGQSLHFGPENTAARGRMLDEIALVVNDEAISFQQLDAEMRAERAFLPKDLALPAAEIEKQLIERIIINHLLKQIQTRANIRITNREIDEALKRIAAQNQLSESALLKQVQRSTGLSPAQYREQLQQNLIIEQIKLGMVGSSVHISEAQINDQIAQIARQQESRLHVQDLLLPLPAGDPVTRAPLVEKQIAAVANTLRRFNQDLAAAAAHIKGAYFNDLGIINIASIPPQFAHALANAESGAMVATPITDSDGIHFLKVVRKENAQGAYQIDQANVSHILLRTGAGRDSRTQQVRIQDIYQQLLAGANFSELARKYSEDPQSAARGGSLGWVSGDDMVSEFAQAMRNQNIDGIYPPIRTTYGFHLLVVHDRKQSDQSEEILRKKVRNVLFGKALEDAWQERLRTLRQEAYVDIRL